MLFLTKMRQTQNFHSSDLMRALDAQPHELRAWLRLEPFASRERKRRSATAYTAFDLLFLAVVKMLDTAGFAPRALQTFSASLYKALQHPVAEGEPDELVLYRGAEGAWKVGAAPEAGNAMELRIAVRSARLQVLRYTGAHLVSGQVELNLLTPLKGKSSRPAKIAVGGRRSSA